jgi:mono/diheme cytochrome c family protein
MFAITAFYSCGGGSEPYKAEGTVKEGETKTETAASPNGIGRFADKTIAAFNKAEAVEGKKLFESKCSACHKPTDEKVVGPGLKGVTSRRSANWILNMITNPVEMTQKDPVAKELLATHLTQMTNQDVNDADAQKLLNFLRENDGAK